MGKKTLRGTRKDRRGRGGKGGGRSFFAAPKGGGKGATGLHLQRNLSLHLLGKFEKKREPPTVEKRRTPPPLGRGRTVILHQGAGTLRGEESPSAARRGKGRGIISLPGGPGSGRK